MRRGRFYDEFYEGRSDAQVRMAKNLSDAAIDLLHLTGREGRLIAIAGWDRLMPIVERCLKGELAPGECIDMAKAVFEGLKLEVDLGKIDIRAFDGTMPHLKNPHDTKRRRID